MPTAHLLSSSSFSSNGWVGLRSLVLGASPDERAGLARGLAAGLALPALWGLVGYAWYQTKRAWNGSSLRRYGANDGQSWAVVTGASSGIGAVFAERLARRGFKVLLVARRLELLEATAAKILARNSNVRAANLRVLSFDLSKCAETHEAFFAAVHELTDDSRVRFVVHMAGNSDLAVHFTDKTLVRNVDLMRLNVESTLVVTQRFADLMTRNQVFPCAVLTSGALSAYASLPGFACSSANKHYVRGLTRAIASEYSNAGIDFMCAHPIAVESEIVKNPWIPCIITAESFVDSCLKDVGVADESNGNWVHDLVVYLLVNAPVTLIQGTWKYFAPQWSSFLNRPINQSLPIDKIDQLRRDGS